MKTMYKMSVRQCYVLFALLLYSTTNIWGQTQDQYIKAMNSLVPTTPEAAGLMKAIDFPVSPFTGKPNISIPLCEVNAKWLSVPVSLSYTASDGIKVNDMASNVGLGFLMFCGGEITREVRGKPDEGCCGAVGLIQNAHHPISFYYDDPNTSPTYMQNAAMGQLDLEPDMFYFTIAGAKGKFMYDEETSAFICTKLEPYKVTFDLPNNKWQIVGPDGNIYLFEKTVTTSTETDCTPGSPSNTPGITTSWKCTKMYNADKTDSIIIEYDYNTYYYYSAGSSTMFQVTQTSNGGSNNRKYQDCFNKNYINGYDHILSISSTTDTVTFQYATDVRQDLGQQQKALAYITYSNGDPTATKIFGMTYDYYIRNSVTGIYNTQQSAENKFSLRLDQITNYGNSLNNANPLKWTFSYNQNSLPARLSYAQDFWGYYNRNYIGNTLAPEQVLVTTDGIPSYSEGADRYADTVTMQAGILNKITFPTGGTTSFEYEANSTGIPTDMARPKDFLSISNVIEQGNLDPSPAFHNESKTFIVNVPHNTTAGLQDGVIATISHTPITPPNQGWVNGISYFSLTKQSNVDGSAGGIGYSKYFDVAPGVTTDFLPNGIYLMSVINNNFYMPPPPPPGSPGDEGDAGTIGVDFQISYNIPDTTKIANYILGGLRVKSIVSQDQYSNVTSKKEYKYQDPVTDSSWGAFTGSTVHLNYEYLRTDQTIFPSGGFNNTACQLVTYLARHGNCILPVGNSLGSTVVYPVVSVLTDEGNKKYKTDYHYNYTAPSYITTSTSNFPYVPPITHEACDGRLLSSTAYQTVGNNIYSPARTIKNTYNLSPATQASNGVVGFRKLIPGMRVAFAGYTEDVLNCGFDYAFNNFYTSEINRADLVADTTITYDLHNSNNGITEWHDYVYGDYNQETIIARTGNSDGTIDKQESYFAIDYPGVPSVLNPGSFQWSLSNANRVNQLLGTKSYKDNQLLSQKQFYGHFNTNDPKMLIDSMQDAILNNPLQTEIKILSYDDAANPLKLEMKGGKYRQYLWKNNLPIATCVSSNKDDYFYFTSFEYPGDNGGTSFGHIFSGNLAFGLSINQPFIVNTPPLTNTDVYFWAANGNIPLTVNGTAPTPTGKARNYKGNWTQYHAFISTGATSVTIRVTQFQPVFPIDDVVIVPHGSQFDGTVYDASNRVTAKIDDQIEASYYEYDDFGNPSIVRDEQGNILKSTTFQYQAAQ